MTESDNYSEEETQRRREAALRKMLGTPPTPHAPKPKPKPKEKPSPAKSKAKKP